MNEFLLTLLIYFCIVGIPLLILFVLFCKFLIELIKWLKRH